ncbi:MAG TPA: tetratricopeptide repeat protein [Pyrinomonadaceae bacterium]
MNGSTVRILPAFLLLISVLTICAPVRAQLTTVSTRPAITVLDSTKEQDGLLGSVRRVKTETAKIELKDGRTVEGPAQLVEVTTYGIKGNRIENTSYPIGDSLVGKEEYKYDERGNITEMTVRDDRGAILNRETYSYEFDKFGNWTKMVTNLVVFENGELKREPVEITYRTLTYYFDDTIAKAVEEPKARRPARAVPEAGGEVRNQEVLEVDSRPSTPTASVELAAQPPPLLKPTEPEGVASAYAARKRNEAVVENVGAPAPTEPPKVESPAPKNEINNQKLANDLYLAGRNRFETGDAPGAIESYLQSIKVEPASAEVHLSLGHAYLKLQKDREAIKAFKESIKLNPTVAETHYGLGYSNFRLGRFKDAADAFKKAITLEPRMAKAHFGLSLAYQELGITSGLMEEYRILETLDRNLAKKLAQTFPQFNFSCRLVRGCP